VGQTVALQPGCAVDSTITPASWRSSSRWSASWV